MPRPALPQGFAYGEGKAAKGPVVTGLRPDGFAIQRPRIQRGATTFKQTMKPAQPAGDGCF